MVGKGQYRRAGVAPDNDRQIPIADGLDPFV
jgi:hypothetical protein